MPRATTNRRIYWAAAPLAALTLVGVAACGSHSGSGSGAPDSAHPRSAQMQAFTQCLASHGVTLPARSHDAGTPPSAAADGTAADGSGGGGRGHGGDMTTPPPGVNQQAWDSARAACASLAPTPRTAPTSTTNS